jgi:uncharacterized protein
MVQFLLYSILIIFILLFILAWVLSNIILKPKVIESDSLYKREIEEGRLDENLYKSWEKEDFNIKSRYGYLLSCQLINNESSKKQFEDKSEKLRIAIICHGYTCGKYSSMMYADLFLKKGITVLTYDHRNHGFSGKAHTTMGYYEKFDLQTILDWCYAEYGTNLSIVTHGESMGAATVLSLHSIDGRVHCTIADCGYTSLEELLKYQMKQYYHLPNFPFYYMAKYMIKLRAGFWIHDVKPIDGAVRSHGAILFVHGLEDNYVPYSMSQVMYEAKPDKKEIYLALGAKHAQSCQKNRIEYENILNNFLEQYYFKS